MSTVERLACARARRSAHERLDGDLLAPSDAAFLEEHVAVCAECRSVVAELEQIQRTLRSVVVPGLDSAALERVWRSTSRSETVRAANGRRVWRAAAAAAALALMLAGLPWLVDQPPRTEMAQPIEIRRAAEEARLVLEVAGRALRRAERAATEDVLADGIGQALDRTSIRWSGAARPRPARGGDGV